MSSFKKALKKIGSSLTSGESSSSPQFHLETNGRAEPKLTEKEIKAQKEIQSAKANQLKKLEELKEKLQDLIAKSPQTAYLYLTLADIYNKQDDFEGALEVYKQGLSSVPSSDAKHAQLYKEMLEVSATISRMKYS